MSHAGWGEVINVMLAQFASEPIELQIAAGLIAALALVMMIEGIRASLFIRHKPPKPAMEPAPAVMVATSRPAAPQAALAPAVTAAPARPPHKITVQLQRPKAVKAKLKPYRSPQPHIQHQNEPVAPFSPLPRKTV